MDNKKTINNLLQSVVKLVNGLTDDEMKKLESGKVELSLKISKVKRLKSDKIPTSILDENVIMKVISQLDSAKTREEGLHIIEVALRNKSELEFFAKHIDVAVMKSDRADKIKTNIVDSTVGARLRSGAIQGKNI